MLAFAARPLLLVLAMTAVGDSAGAPIAVVTGGNTGIGYYTAGQLASAGYAVVIGCRSVARGEAAAATLTEAGGDVINRQLDLSSFASVLKFAEELKGMDGELKLLICNAGLNSASAEQEPSRQLSSDGVDKLYQTNYLSHFLLTLLLLPLLRRAKGRVINVSSVVHRSASLDDFSITTEIRDPYVSLYGLSKLAQIVSSYALHKRYGEDVAFHCVNPGGVASDIWRGYAGWQQAVFSRLLISPETAAKTVVKAATADEGCVPAPPRYWNGYRGASLSTLFEFWSPIAAREALEVSEPSQDHQSPALQEALWEQSALAGTAISKAGCWRLWNWVASAVD